MIGEHSSTTPISLIKEPLSDPIIAEPDTLTGPVYWPTSAAAGAETMNSTQQSMCKNMLNHQPITSSIMAQKTTNKVIFTNELFTFRTTPPSHISFNWLAS